MTNKELRRALKQLGVSQMELSRRIKVWPQTVRSWISGKSPIPEAVALLLKEWMGKRSE